MNISGRRLGSRDPLEGEIFSHNQLGIEHSTHSLIIRVSGGEANSLRVGGSNERRFMLALSNRGLPKTIMASDLRDVLKDRLRVYVLCLVNTFVRLEIQRPHSGRISIEEVSRPRKCSQQRPDQTFAVKVVAAVEELWSALFHCEVELEREGEEGGPEEKEEPRLRRK